MRRRAFVAGLAAASLPLTARAQARMRRVGLIMSGTPDSHGRYLTVIKKRFAELGYVEGQTIVIDVEWLEGQLDRVPAAVARLIQRRPDAIIAPTTTMALAVKKAAPDMPTVFVTVADPVGSGLVASYARPGGNATGIQGNLDSLPGKQIELIREIVPGVVRVGMLINRLNVSTFAQSRNAQAAAKSLGVALLTAELTGAGDLWSAFERLARQDVKAIVVPTDATLLTERKRVAELELSLKLPAVYQYREHVEAGGLISYGVDVQDSYRRSVEFIDKILKGARPADLPVEIPTKFLMVVNLRTAKAIGLTIPESFLLRADEVIE